MINLTNLDPQTLFNVKIKLNEAKRNGYDFANHNDVEVAGDMIAYCNTFESWNEVELARYVKEAREQP